MKILFVYPRFAKFFSYHPLMASSCKDYIIGSYSAPPSLGIPILSALTPPNHDVRFVNDNTGDPVPYDEHFDLVAISYFTPQAIRAFEIGDEFRRRGVTVIAGGIFPTSCPEQAREHADSVHIGEAELTWQGILSDAERGALKPLYNGGLVSDLARIPIPDRNIYYGNAKYRWNADMLQVGRGCFYNCPTCVVPGNFGKAIRFRPIERVVQELETLEFKMFYLAEDSVFFTAPECVEYATRLFEALKPYGKRVFISTPPVINTQPRFLDTLLEGGLSVVYMTFLLDPISNRALSQPGSQAYLDMVETVRSLQKRGVKLYAAFWLGHDLHDEGIADTCLNFIADAEISVAEFNVYTPYPNTRMYRTLSTQGRILHRDWSRYNGAHVAFVPKQVSPERLQELYLDAWTRFCSSIDMKESSAWIT